MAVARLPGRAKEFDLSLPRTFSAFNGGDAAGNDCLNGIREEGLDFSPGDASGFS